MGGWLGGWVARSNENENITISTQVKVVVEVGVELCKNHKQADKQTTHTSQNCMGLWGSGLGKKS